MSWSSMAGRSRQVKTSVWFWSRKAAYPNTQGTGAEAEECWVWVAGMFRKQKHRGDYWVLVTISSPLIYLLICVEHKEVQTHPDLWLIMIGHTGGRLLPTWQAHWEFLSNLPAIYPGDNFWTHLKKAQQYTHQVYLEKPIVLISINSLGTLRTNSKCTHKFAQNVPTIYLSHSLRVLLKNTLKFVHNVPTGFDLIFSKRNLNVVQFHQRSSINSVGIYLGTLWTYCRTFFERTLNE